MLQCAKQTIDALSNDGWTIKNVHTLQRWQKQFKQRELFVNPLTERSCKDNLPCFLQNEDVTQAMRIYCRLHLGQLTTELVQEYVLDNVLPNLVRPPDDPDPENAQSAQPPTVTEEEKQAKLAEFGLTCLSAATVYRWMRALGFKYEARKKYYFVDGHEKDGTKAYWKV